MGVNDIHGDDMNTITVDCLEIFGRTDPVLIRLSGEGAVHQQYRFSPQFFIVKPRKSEFIEWLLFLIAIAQICPACNAKKGEINGLVTDL